MSAFHSRISRDDLSAVLQRRHQFAVVDVEHFGVRAENLSSSFGHFFGRRWASGPPAICQWPMSPLVTEQNITWWPCLAHFGPDAAGLYSASSGCAPNTMMRSLPSSGGSAADTGAARLRQAKRVRQRNMGAAPWINESAMYFPEYEV